MVLDRLGAIESGNSAVAILSGEAGIGKSRLLAEVCGRLAAFQRVAAAATAIGRLRPFSLLSDAMRSDPALRPRFDASVGRELAMATNELEIVDAFVRPAPGAGGRRADAVPTAWAAHTSTPSS